MKRSPPAAAREPLRLAVSPLTEFDQLDAFQRALAAIDGVQAAELVEYDLPVATYVVAGLPPERLVAALAAQRDLAATGLTIKLIAPVPAAAPPVPQPAVPDLEVHTAGQPERAPTRSPWIWLGLAVVVLGGALALILTVGKRHAATAVPARSTPAAVLPARTPISPVSAGAPVSTPTVPRATRTAAPVTAPVIATSPAPPVTATPSPAAPAAPVAAPAVAIAVLNGLLRQGLPIAAQPTTPAGPALAAVSFRDTRLAAVSGPAPTANGGIVEVFASVAAAEVRLQQLTRINAVVPDVAEHDLQRGVVLLRLSSRLTPGQVQQYGTALAALAPTTP